MNLMSWVFIIISMVVAVVFVLEIRRLWFDQTHLQQVGFDAIKTGRKDFLRHATVIIILLASIFLIAYIAIVFGNILWFITIFSYVSAKLAGLGLNPYLAKAIAMPISGLALFGGLMLFSRDKTKQRLGIIVVAGGISISYLVMYAITRDHNFDAKTGQAIRHFVNNVDGTITILEPGQKFDPVTGREAKPMSVDRVSEEQIKKNGLPQNTRLSPNRDSVFFDQDGHPLAYYVYWANGKLEFFASPGYFGGVKLQPVNQQIISLFYSYLDQGRQDLIIFNDTPIRSDNGSNVQANANSVLQNLKIRLDGLKLKQ